MSLILWCHCSGFKLDYTSLADGANMHHPECLQKVCHAVSLNYSTCSRAPLEKCHHPCWTVQSWPQALYQRCIRGTLLHQGSVRVYTRNSSTHVHTDQPCCCCRMACCSLHCCPPPAVLPLSHAAAVCATPLPSTTTSLFRLAALPVFCYASTCCCCRR